jgi:hypothetical protein
MASVRAAAVRASTQTVRVAAAAPAVPTAAASTAAAATTDEPKRAAKAAVGPLFVNRVTLIGNAGQEPQITRINEQTEVARFSLATSHPVKDASGACQRPPLPGLLLLSAPPSVSRPVHQRDRLAQHCRVRAAAAGAAAQGPAPRVRPTLWHPRARRV